MYSTFIHITLEEKSSGMKIIELVPRLDQAITVLLQNVEYWDVDWLVSTQARVQRQTIVNTRMNVLPIN